MLCNYQRKSHEGGRPSKVVPPYTYSDRKCVYTLSPPGFSIMVSDSSTRSWIDRESEP